MDRRTTLLSAVAVSAVVLAGGAAVAANIGILGAANNDSIGQLTASGGIGFADPAPTVPASTDVAQPIETVATPTPASAPASGDTELFRVGDVGLVAVVRTTDGIALVDVTPEPGWSWAPSTGADGQLVVTFAAGNDRYVFTAELGPDGMIAARVDQIVAPPAATGTTGSSATPEAESTDDDSPHHVEYEEHEGGDDDD